MDTEDYWYIKAQFFIRNNSQYNANGDLNRYSRVLSKIAVAMFSPNLGDKSFVDLCTKEDYDKAFICASIRNKDALRRGMIQSFCSMVRKSEPYRQFKRNKNLYKLLGK